MKIADPVWLLFAERDLLEGKFTEDSVRRADYHGDFSSLNLVIFLIYSYSRDSNYNNTEVEGNEDIVT